MSLQERKLAIAAELSRLTIGEGTVGHISSWFNAARRVPTPAHATTQYGVNLEEVSEGMKSAGLTGYAEDLARLANAVKANKVVGLQFGQMTPQEHVQFLDDLCDQIVTAIGTATFMGYDICGALREVDNSNWTKFDSNGNPVFLGNGKIGKSERFVPPQLAKYLGQALERQAVWQEEKRYDSE